MRKFAISDIHGCASTFRALLEKIELTPTDQLFLLGDYVDRGPDSKGVIDYILELREKGFWVKCLKGNHEERMQVARTSSTVNEIWLRSGGQAALESFGVDAVRNIPQKYWHFIDQLETFHVEGPYLMVHAGLNFKLENPMDDHHAMLWIRDWYRDINYNWLKDKIILHGHIQFTCQEIEAARQALSNKKVLGIDCGCSTRDVPGRGYLCAFELIHQTCTFQVRLD